MKILFCGGGSLGPVTPLLAVLRQIRKQDPKATFAWVGTPTGPEGALVEAENVPFHALPVAKMPRYLSVELVKFPVKFFQAKKEAKRILAHEHPDLVVTAGGFSGVPMIQQAAKEGVPCALHQLDFVPGLSNKAIAEVCGSVTTSFRYSDPPFGPSIVSDQVNTPCRFPDVTMPSVEDAKRFFGINADRKVLLVMGGGTGAMAINNAIAAALDELLPHVEIIHSTGAGKGSETAERPGYHPFELLNEREMRCAYVAADMVLTRAGLGALSELAALKKTSIVVPIPHNQQEANARALEKGIVWLHQTERGFGEAIRSMVMELLKDEARRKELGETLYELLPTDDGSELTRRWKELL